MEDDELADLISSTWRDVLNCSEPGDESNFFTELGGNSLLAFQATMRLRSGVGAKVPLRLLFDHRKFGEYVEAVADELPPDAVPPAE